MKKFLTILLLLLFVFPLSAGEGMWIECREKGFKGHLQGIAADENGIYWSFTDVLLKTDYTGKTLISRPVFSHCGDICVVDGKIYAAMVLRLPEKEMAKFDNWSGWIFEFDAATLELTGKYKSHKPRIDGITFASGKFYVGVDGGRNFHPVNEILICDRNFKLLETRTIDIGQPTRYGAQTLNFVQGKLLASFYSDKRKKACFFTPDDISRPESFFPQRCSFGLAEIPESFCGEKDVFLLAHNTGTRRNWSAKLQIVKYAGGKLIPVKLKNPGTR